MIYLDNASTTPLTPQVKAYIISLLDIYQNPSSLYQSGVTVRTIIEQARNNVAKFINGKPENIIFTSGGSAANSLLIKGITSESLAKNEYEIFYSPTAHKSMTKACESCFYHTPLRVDQYGAINLTFLKRVLSECWMKPLVCVEWGNSEIGTINDIAAIAEIVHAYNGILFVDATGYIPTCKVDMKQMNCIDFLSFSGHKLHALKGVGVLYRNNDCKIKPLIYGSQEQGLFGGTENVLGIASLGKAVENYDYSSISSENRDYVYQYILENIPDSCLVGTIGKKRLPHNLYVYLHGIKGESLMILMDMNNIQIGTGSACNSGSPLPSSALLAIGMDEEDARSCIRLTFSGNETKKELDFVCEQLKKNVELLRKM